VGDPGEAVDGRRLERAIDEKRVMMTDEGYVISDSGTEGEGERGRDGPKEMTPTAWKKPSLIVNRAVLNSPFSELGTRNP
jgi:hypothetical protein